MSLTLFHRVLPFVKGGWHDGWGSFLLFPLVGIVVGTN
tara:strand:- start:27 stop:140 length:114 start_codon:yes stop_codon:yes gene_type:complete